MVDRAMAALRGELARRQRLLHHNGNQPDLRAYTARRALDPRLEPLPQLLIVVDEFGELLAARPEFLDLFAALGRVGRSLGMHLLLASQRLDEGRLRGLETHLSYRICLKTFSASESRAVLGVADAHHLPTTPGAAYLKTASGELVRFHTAFVSGPHNVQGNAPPLSVEPAIPREFTAAPVGPIPELDRPTGRSDSPSRTVLDAVLDRLAGHGTPAHPVWLPPLRDSPTLDAVLSGEGPPLAIPIG